MARPFRGWHVVGAGMLMLIAASPGTTDAMNAFIDSFIDAFRMSRKDVSYSLVIASLFSAVAAPFVGEALDSYGARRMFKVVASSHVLLLLLFSGAQSGAQTAACLAGLRLLGPESLTLIASTTVNRWFERHRGKASAALLSTDIVVVLAPTFCKWIIKKLGWRGSYATLAGLSALLLLPAAWAMRDSPESEGLRPDGEAAEPEDHETERLQAEELDDDEALEDEALSPAGAGGAARRAEPRAPLLAAASLRDATRQPIFWWLALVCASLGFFWGGLNHFYISICASLGGDLLGLAPVHTTGFLFTNMAVTSGVSRVLAGFAIDAMSPAQRVRAFGWLSAAVAGVSATFLLLKNERDLVAFGTVHGVFAGAWATSSLSIAATLFGTEALGALFGLQLGAGVAGAGLGPEGFSGALDQTDTFAPAIVYSCALALAGSALFLRAACRVRPFAEASAAERRNVLAATVTHRPPRVRVMPRRRLA